ncbi:hypothetical protein OGAPHI_004589 [Ogataea philodendri]|uniref:Squalene synthase ERG9 n=1 Tax=Ogataea philodendri TaxID=1378263 RepID=A0A9P8P2X0_9ASCO|nr:uncharacterized protein OGAPHI_004589 [Ogataea philodendri]KAH3664237.1 hypothetical protein OGAPHI_004589 [Ogataea philodendri]
MVLKHFEIPLDLRIVQRLKQVHQFANQFVKLVRNHQQARIHLLNDHVLVAKPDRVDRVLVGNPRTTRRVQFHRLCLDVSVDAVIVVETERTLKFGFSEQVDSTNRHFDLFYLQRASEACSFQFLRFEHFVLDLVDLELFDAGPKLIKRLENRLVLGKIELPVSGQQERHHVDFVQTQVVQHVPKQHFFRRGPVERPVAVGEQEDPANVVAFHKPISRVLEHFHQLVCCDQGRVLCPTGDCLCIERFQRTQLVDSNVLELKNRNYPVLTMEQIAPHAGSRMGLDHFANELTNTGQNRRQVRPHGRCQFKFFKKTKYPINPETQSPTEKACYTMLTKTSRSFAAVIMELNPELRNAIMLFYLVLRALDTIEDDMTISPDEKIPLLRSFDSKLLLKDWTYNGNGPNEKDRIVLVEFDKILAEYHKLNPKYQDVIKDIAFKMGNGMADYVINEEFNLNGVATVKEYDLYCYYVAGLVGEGLTKMTVAANFGHPDLLEKIDLSLSMGAFLQKTNIIRDFREDLDDGRSFWPKEIWGNHAEKLVDFTKPDQVQAGLSCISELTLNVLELVPDVLIYLSMVYDHSTYCFCAIPQVMAIATLTLVFQNPKVFQRNVKIRKGETCKLILESRTYEGVLNIFSSYLNELHHKCPVTDPYYLEIGIKVGQLQQFIEQLNPDPSHLPKGLEPQKTNNYNLVQKRIKQDDVVKPVLQKEQLACRTTVAINVFNRDIKLKQRERAARNTESTMVEYIRDEVARRSIERLAFLKTPFTSIMDFGCNSGNFERQLCESRPDDDKRWRDDKHLVRSKIGKIYMVDSSKSMLEKHSDETFNSLLNIQRVNADEEQYSHPVLQTSDMFNVIISNLSLHWINDLPTVFQNLYSSLQPNGCFIGSMFAGDTLFELRSALQMAELERCGELSPRVSPFVESADVATLMKNAGFQMLTIDVEEIIVEYPDVLSLMKDLQLMGESNSILGTPPALKKDLLIALQPIYQAFYPGSRPGMLPATFKFVFMVGWKPGSQPIGQL